MSKEAIEKKLEKAKNMLITDGHYEGCPNQTDDDSCPVCMIYQALVLLKEQPPASREFITMLCARLDAETQRADKMDMLYTKCNTERLQAEASLKTSSDAGRQLGRMLKEADAEIHKIRPFADCYKRICEILGIEKDVLGYIEQLEAKLKDLQEALRKYGDHEPCCVKGDACTCGYEAAIAKANEG